MQRSAFHYSLPPELVAHYPLPERTASRLLVLDPVRQQRIHTQFARLPDYIEPGDLVVLNNSRVMKARLWGYKTTGGKVEILIERILEGQCAWAHVRANRAPKIGSRLLIAEQIEAVIIGRESQLFIVQFHTEQPIVAILEQHGEIPLPPYLRRAAEHSDHERYQSVFAERLGSVAAPTAGLHFNHSLLAQLAEKGVRVAFITLHVGAGTFQPVRVENIAQHSLHPEYVNVPEETCQAVQVTKEQGKRVIAVGTTVARSLETAGKTGNLRPFSGESRLFIYPGYSFQVIDALLTNFHLPESTLLMLTCAFGGYETVMQAYQEAIKQRYRFYSYGDAMLITTCARHDD